MLLSLLFACFPDLSKNDPERFLEYPAGDYDGDGYSENQGDCDDLNPNVRPYAEEHCDGLDNDCNGLVDDGALEIQYYYADTDGDGFGRESSSVLVCPADKPDGYIEAKERNGVVVFDCDDGSAVVHPDALEICDDQDNDCDGYEDEEDGEQRHRWYVDGDGDGYGVYASESDVEYSCDGLVGYSPNFLDCDDSNADKAPNLIEMCDGIDNNCDGNVDEASASDALIWLRDEDLDGYGSRYVTARGCSQPVGYVFDSGNYDCNDQVSMISPIAQELCNGVDDNCNNLVDEGADSTAPSNAPVYYEDADGDGYGNLHSTRVQCSVPSNYVSDASDCDDLESSVHPNANEYCNGVDDNCDGNIDGADALNKTVWYADADSDGYGFGGISQYACVQPAMYVAVAGDCVDTDSLVHPNATEICDGVDNNCDGFLDDADGNVDLNTASVFYRDGDSDGYGNQLNTTRRCLQPPGYVTDTTDCDDTNVLINPQGVEKCNNLDDNCDGNIDEYAVNANHYYVDVDGDGHGSLVNTVQGFDLSSCPVFDTNVGLFVTPAGYSLLNNDCNDGDAVISPSARELCTNTVDENCDGHNLAGATDVSTFLVDADGDGFGSGLRTVQGDLAYALDLCVQPYGYVLYEDGDSLDCDDGDVARKPGAVELCNGQLDNCASDGNTVVPSDEIDHDGDGYVLCALDVDPLQWADLTAGIVGGEDCDDSDEYVYPNAPELCNGAFENCTDPLYIMQTAPDQEIDDDGDCFVECSGFDANRWEGGVHSCSHVNSMGQVVQENVVIGGGDCNDDNAYTYVGAAYAFPETCAQDVDVDGNPDCNLVGLVGLNTNYHCDFGVFLANGGMGPDFVLVQGGLEPLGRYTLTNDFYVMTTEVTQGMWTSVMNGSGYGYTPSYYDGTGPLYPVYNVSWYDAIAFANRLSVLTGREECYANTDTLNVDPQQEYNPDDVSSSFSTPYDCRGFRLLTDAEWEYAARSGTTSDFWTGQSSALGGTYSSNNCTGLEMILDGVGNPLLTDYAWYCGYDINSSLGDGSKGVGQKKPNGFGLYDMHGNVWEWVNDWYGCAYPESTTNPYCNSVGSYRANRGGGWYYYPLHLSVANRDSSLPTYRDYGDLGFRLGITP